MRLPRKYIPLDTRIEVALRQCLAADIATTAQCIMGTDLTKSYKLESLLEILFGKDNYKRAELHHRPALMNRKKIYDRHTGKIIRYVPDELNPDHLIYLLDDDHDIETRVRGVGAQLSDQAKNRKNKKIDLRLSGKKKKHRWPKRKINAGMGWQKTRKSSGRTTRSIRG